MAVKLNGKTYFLPGENGQRTLTLAEQRKIERAFRKPIEKILSVIELTEKQIKSMPEEKQDEIEVQRREVAQIMIWVARLRAGEDLTFDEATDVEISELGEDDTPESEANPTTKA